MTIFTIGYGDILPTNNLEIGCVLIMQMFGKDIIMKVLLIFLT